MISRRTLVIGATMALAGAPLAPALARPAEAPRRKGESARLHPRDFGAKGDGETDDTEALLKLAAAANAAAQARQPVEIHIAGRHAVSRTITLRPAGAPFSVIGQGGRTGFVALGGERFDCLALRGGASAGRGMTIGAAAQKGSTRLALGGEGLRPGAVLLVSNATGFEKDRRECLVEVTSVSGGQVSLKKPLPFDLDPRHIATATPLTLAGGVRVVNLTFEGSRATGGSTGLHLTFLRDPFVEGIRSSGFGRPLASGQIYGPCLGGRYNDLEDSGSGWAGSTDSIKFVNISGGHISEVSVTRSAGFGIGITFVSDSRIGTMRSIGSAGRGFKLFGSCHNDLTTIVVQNSGKTGLSISSGSSYNSFSGVEARGNKESGVWLNGTGNNHNRFTKVMTTGNGIDLMVAATAPLVDRGNVFSGQLAGFDKTVIAPETGTVLQR